MDWSSWRINRRRRDTHEIVKVETNAVERLPQSYLDELARIKQDLQRFQDSQDYVLPKALQEILERLERLEQIPDKILTEEIKNLRKGMRGFAALVDMIKADVEAANQRGEANRTAIRALMQQMDVMAGEDAA